MFGRQSNYNLKNFVFIYTVFLIILFNRSKKIIEVFKLVLLKTSFSLWVFEEFKSLELYLRYILPDISGHQKLLAMFVAAAEFYTNGAFPKP